VGQAKVLGNEGVYTSGHEVLSKAAAPTAETPRVFMTAREAKKWVESTSQMVRHSTRIIPDPHSSLYRGDPSRQDLHHGFHEMGLTSNPVLSGNHLHGAGLKQGEATLGPDPSTGKEDTLFNTRVLSESQVRERLTPSGVGPAIQKRLSEAYMLAQPIGNLTTDCDSELTGCADLLRGHQNESSLGLCGQTPTPHQQAKCTTI
jgi:hypothetical protein